MPSKPSQGKKFGGRRVRLTRRQLLLGSAGGALATAAGLGHMRYVEPRDFRVTRKVVPIGTPQPIRVAHLSDFHLSRSVSPELIASAIDMALAESPDMICLTGDYITDHPDLNGVFEEAFGALRPFETVYASFGNHDGGTWRNRRAGLAMQAELRHRFERMGVMVLENECVAHATSPLDIVGLGDLWAGRFRPEDVLSTAPNGRATLVLSHNPDTKTALFGYDWDLLLCGHTHGGQANVLGWRPFLGGVVQDTGFAEGLRCFQGRHWVHITRGVGSLLGMRFGCPPEISILELI